MASPRSDYHHGDLAEALIEQALKVLREAPAEALSLRALSETIGVSHSAAYRHFPSKKALLDGVCERGFRRFRDAVLEAKGQDGLPVPEQLERMAGCYIRFALAQPNLYLLMFGPGFAERMCAPETGTSASESFAVLLSSVQRGLALGVLAPASAFLLSQTIWALLHGFALFALHGELSAEHAEESARRAWGFLYRGVGVGCPDSPVENGSG